MPTLKSRKELVRTQILKKRRSPFFFLILWLPTIHWSCEFAKSAYLKLKNPFSSRFFSQGTISFRKKAFPAIGLHCWHFLCILAIAKRFWSYTRFLRSILSDVKMEENIVKYLCMKFQVILRTHTITGENINDFANYYANSQNSKIFLREKKWVYTPTKFLKIWVLTCSLRVFKVGKWKNPLKITQRLGPHPITEFKSFVYLGTCFHPMFFFFHPLLRSVRMKSGLY